MFVVAAFTVVLFCILLYQQGHSTRVLQGHAFQGTLLFPAYRHHKEEVVGGPAGLAFPPQTVVSNLVLDDQVWVELPASAFAGQCGKQPPPPGQGDTPPLSRPSHVRVSLPWTGSQLPKLHSTQVVELAPTQDGWSSPRIRTEVTLEAGRTVWLVDPNHEVCALWGTPHAAAPHPTTIPGGTWAPALDACWTDPSATPTSDVVVHVTPATKVTLMLPNAYFNTLRDAHLFASFPTRACLVLIAVFVVAIFYAMGALMC